jgi:hypothetical protein
MAAEILLRCLSERELTEKEIVEGFISAVCMQKKSRKHLTQAIICKDLLDVPNHYNNAL